MVVLLLDAVRQPSVEKLLSKSPSPGIRGGVDDLEQASALDALEHFVIVAFTSPCRGRPKPNQPCLTRSPARNNQPRNARVYVRVILLMRSRRRRVKQGAYQKLGIGFEQMDWESSQGPSHLISLRRCAS